MEPTRFDELTKALATATSRRQALRRIGGILGGTALAGLFPGLAFASNSACTTFCNAVFGAETQAAGKCISDAAHHKGLCYSCSNATPSSICCTRNANNYCTSYSPTLPCSCPMGQTCQNGSCVATCSLGLQQPCTSASQCCDTGQGKTTCENNTLGVECCNTPGGSCSNDFDCCGLTLCGSNGTCQCQLSGHVCLYNTDCCSGTCNNSGPGTGGTCA